MMRTRVVFLSTSVMVVILFTGMIVASRETKEDLFKALGNLAEVIHLVRNEYVDELNTEALELSLDAGIVESVDQAAAVLPETEVEAYQSLSQSPPPFGLVLASRLSSAAVRHVMTESPAATAGIQQWEVIERVEGVNTRGRPLWQVRLELAQRERSGQTVSLTVMDRDVEDRREVMLSPTEWEPSSVSVQTRAETLVLQIDSLPAGAVAQVADEVQPERALVLDLRQLVWGLEGEAIAVADLFVNEGVLGGWRGRRAGAQTFQATDGSLLSQPPVVVIGHDTEGVGEILAAALQRSGATVVGHRSAGHAPHMRIVRDDEINLWLPVGLWLRGDDEPIDGNGVVPDEVIETAPESDEELDPVLDRAIELAGEPLEQAA
jgi:C-terminal processing protease CtpA/Prc